MQYYDALFNVLYHGHGSALISLRLSVVIATYIRYIVTDYVQSFPVFPTFMSFFPMAGKKNLSNRWEKGPCPIQKKRTKIKKYYISCTILSTFSFKTKYHHIWFANRTVNPIVFKVDQHGAEWAQSGKFSY